MFCRGQTFRKVLLRIAEIRSLVPPGVHMMSLTATATTSLRQEVSGILGMKNPLVIAVSPSKHNILYTVESSDSFQQAFTSIVEGLQKQRAEFPRTIIYCQKAK